MRIASPPFQLVSPMVLPVATNKDPSIAATPDIAQMPPPWPVR